MLAKMLARAQSHSSCTQTVTTKYFVNHDAKMLRGVTFLLHPQVHPRCNPGAPQVHPRCTPGAPQVHPRCTPGAPQVHPRCIPGAPQVHPRCTRRVPGARQAHQVHPFCELLEILCAFDGPAPFLHLPSPGCALAGPSSPDWTQGGLTG